jgi:uncharacterized membrane protein
MFAGTYFLLLFLSAAVAMLNLLYGESLAFFLPFIIGGLGSLLLYFAKTLKNPYQGEHEKNQAKTICHAFCGCVYIIGAFLLLVFYDAGFVASWSFHVWIIPSLIVAFRSKKDFVFMALLLFGIFLSLFVLEFEGLLGRAVTAVGMGSFWGFAFYHLLSFLTRISDIYKHKAHREAGHEIA